MPYDVSFSDFDRLHWAEKTHFLVWWVHCMALNLSLVTRTCHQMIFCTYLTAVLPPRITTIRISALRKHATTLKSQHFSFDVHEKMTSILMHFKEGKKQKTTILSFTAATVTIKLHFNSICSLHSVCGLKCSIMNAIV